MTATLMERLRCALKHELPSTSFDEDTIKYLLNAVQGADSEISVDEVVETWAPFLISFNAADNEEDTRKICCGVLDHLRHSALMMEVPWREEKVTGPATLPHVNDKSGESALQVEQLQPGGGAKVRGLAEWLPRAEV
mmetsp:Transcript_89316/g.207862  ORF Transcript_89316/g.207862 Transcript_89316/m.207862 type:complete len:137 (+) Transcript_89316:104-514(+)